MKFSDGGGQGFFVKKIRFFLDVCLSFGHVKPVVVVTRPVLADPSLSPPPLSQAAINCKRKCQVFGIISKR